MLRTLFKSDLPNVLAIEKSVHILPWTEETFETCFQSGYIGWVIELNQSIVGFVVISISESDCHVLNISVSREHQHQGFGRKLLTFALEYAKNKGTRMAYLEVRRSNSHAISLYQKMNFHLVGERKAYYPTPQSGHEDALVFAKSLIGVSDIQ
jgi:ribosomal-protein-alanine N-acetyltransferase